MKKISKYARAKKNGTTIFCPKCDKGMTVYHFAWFALICQGCKAEIEKTDFNSERATYLIPLSELLGEEI